MIYFVLNFICGNEPTPQGRSDAECIFRMDDFPPSPLTTPPVTPPHSYSPSPAPPASDSPLTIPGRVSSGESKPQDSPGSSVGEHSPAELLMGNPAGLLIEKLLLTIGNGKSDFFPGSDLTQSCSPTEEPGSFEDRFRRALKQQTTPLS